MNEHAHHFLAESKKTVRVVLTETAVTIEDALAGLCVVSDSAEKQYWISTPEAFKLSGVEYPKFANLLGIETKSGRTQFFSYVRSLHFTGKVAGVEQLGKANMKLPHFLKSFEASNASSHVETYVKQKQSVLHTPEFQVDRKVFRYLRWTNTVVRKLLLGKSQKKFSKDLFRPFLVYPYVHCPSPFGLGLVDKELTNFLEAVSTIKCFFDYSKRSGEYTLQNEYKEICWSQQHCHNQHTRKGDYTVSQRVLDVEGVKNLTISIEAMGALPKDRAELLRERTANFRITPEGKALLDSTLNSWERDSRKEVS